jgi:cystathionine beta-lyase
MNKKSGAEPSRDLKPDTLLSVGGRDPFAHHGYVNTPVYHASTLLYPSAADYVAHRGRYQYGRRGTPTSEALETAIQVLDGPACAAVALLPSGLAAISSALLSVLRTGDNVLVPTAPISPPENSATACSPASASPRHTMIH